MKKFIIVSICILIFVFIVTFGITQVFARDEEEEVFEEEIPTVETVIENQGTFNSKLETLTMNDRGIIKISGYVNRTDKKDEPLNVKVYVGHQVYHLDVNENGDFSDLITTSEEGIVPLSVWAVNQETDELEYLISYQEQFTIIENIELNYNQKIFIIVLIFGLAFIVTSGIFIVLNIKEDKEDAKKQANKYFKI